MLGKILLEVTPRNIKTYLGPKVFNILGKK